jgi:N-acetylmuramoyl-L-alanine amidase
MLKRTMIYGAAFLLLSIGAMPAQAAVTHRITRGESLYKIAARNGVSVIDLKQTNGLRGNLIFAGDRLTIPDEVNQKPAQPTPTDLELLARLVTAEAGGESFQGQVAVASVILNRVEDGRFPRTITGNVFKRHEFESVSNGQIWRQPTPEAYRAAKAALRGWDPTSGARFFFNPAKVSSHSWVWTRTVIDRIGNHVFAV